MGCDIHLFVEKNNNGVWESVDEWEKEGEYTNVIYEKRYYNEGDYNLFALLANVRNYNDITPIMQPRGFPNNVSPEVQKISNYYDCDGHSHSYFTLEEINNFDWEQPIKEAGYMGDEQWIKFNDSLNSENPDYMLRYPCSETYRNLGQTLKNTLHWHEWKLPVKVFVGNFFTKTLPKLTELGEPKNVRIVFFFDN